MGMKKTVYDGEALVLEIREVWSTSLLPLLPGRLWLEVVVPVIDPSMGQIELSRIFLFNKNTWCYGTKLFELV